MLNALHYTLFLLRTSTSLRLMRKSQKDTIFHHCSLFSRSVVFPLTSLSLLLTYFLFVSFFLSTLFPFLFFKKHFPLLSSLKEYFSSDRQLMTSHDDSLLTSLCISLRSGSRNICDSWRIVGPERHHR